MDISKANNFERFIFDIFGGDTERVNDLFTVQLAQKGYFDISDTAEFASIPERYGFVSGTSSHADRINAIADVWRDDGYIIDPHTADGVTVARKLRHRSPVIVTETALPVKFAATIREAIGRDPERPARFEGLESLPQRVINIPKDEDALREIIESVD
jgi:threonine synthase